MTEPRIELPPPRRAHDERETLVAMLDHYRGVLMRKAEGLTPEQLQRTLGPSPLTIGGLVVHMAAVEDGWFQMDILGRDHPFPGRDASWAAGRSADDLVATLRGAIGRSDDVLAGVDSLEQMTVHPDMADDQANVRWVLVHMIEEYARHCGHADLLRESIDGAVGD